MTHFSYSTDVPHYGRLDGTVTATSPEAAGKKAWEKLAIQMVSTRVSKEMSARVARAKELVGASYLRLVNDDTGDDWAWRGSRGWVSYVNLRREQENRKRQDEEDERRGYILRDEVKLPPRPLTLERVVDTSGRKPEGSSGSAHLLEVKDGVAYISDAATVGRFWPAVWDWKKRQWVVLDFGEQFSGGEVVERFPVEVRKTRTIEALAERHRRRPSMISVGGVR